jgi:hypothetical protein
VQHGRLAGGGLVTVRLYAAEATSSTGGASQQAIRFEFEVLTKKKRAAPGWRALGEV